MSSLPVDGLLSCCLLTLDSYRTRFTELYICTRIFFLIVTENVCACVWVWVWGYEWPGVFVCVGICVCVGVCGYVLVNAYHTYHMHLCHD